MLRHWLNNYFVHDFIGNRPLRRILTDFLNKLPRHPLVKESPRDQRIVKILKRVVRRLKKLYYNRSSGASRVKVIAPPPPTAEQEQMGEIVRAKLSQNAIRRKTALGVDMSSHHNGNMAVQDARYAPVVVVGSLNMKGSFIDSGLDNNKSSFVQLRRYPSQHSVPPQTSHDIDNTVVTGLEDNQTIRSSIHHRYDKSVHEASDFNGEGGTNLGAGGNEASSVISVASDDSLESELSAGETIPDESEEEDDDHSHIQQESCVEYDEHERHWMQEQQETLEYFKSLSNNKPGVENPSNSLAQLDTSYNHPVIGNMLNESPTQLTSAASHVRPKIPPEFIQTDKADLTSEYSSPSTPTTPTHATAKKDSATQKGIRRIPSERWCKTDDYQNRHPLELDHGKSLPDELLKELSGDESQHKSPLGLSRKLSKKSIERRKSERSFQDPSWSSAPSSATTSPYLTGAISDHDIPDVPELPPLTSDMLGGTYKSRSKAVKKKSLLPKKKASHPDDLLIDTSDALEAFASIPYESTKVNVKAQEEVKEDTQSNKVPKRRLSRAISKVFRPSQEEKVTKESDIPKTPTSTEQKPELPPSAEVEKKQEEKQGGGQLVSLIAQRLRLNSVDDSETEELACDCAKCSGKKENTATCRRLSVMLIPDAERRRSFELRRRRGASVDMSQQDLVNHLGAMAQEQKNGKDLKSGPVYLGHLQARSAIGSNVMPEDNDSVHDSSDDDDDDDNSTASFAPSERSIQTEAQASSSRARMSFISDATSQVPRSKLIELGIPPVLPTHQHIPDMGPQNNNEANPSIPRPINNILPKPSGRCFIMSYRTSMIASQLCFIERDVLVKVGWEELIHCKWTKMDASGKINPNYANQSNFEDDIDDEKINYTRQSEMRRTEEQGIEQVIQRFNTVCQWVSSEIVRTRNIHERVRLIEKFIRLAKVKGNITYA